jgi:hypothetical protein
MTDPFYPKPFASSRSQAVTRARELGAPGALTARFPPIGGMQLAPPCAGMVLEAPLEEPNNLGGVG